MAVCALVMLPSEAPPTAACSSGMPRSSAPCGPPPTTPGFAPWAWSGGRPNPPSTSIVIPARVARPRMAFRAGGRPPRGARASMSATTSGATTLGRSPPSIVPTFTVTPRSGSFSSNSCWIWCEASRIALTPCSGLSPAWLASPLIRSRNRATPLRAVFSLPAGPNDGSSTYAHDRARDARDVGGRARAPDLLVAVDEDHRAHARLEAHLRERTEREQHLDQAALHVEHARPTDAALLHFHRHPLDGADRPDGVQVAEQELARGALHRARRLGLDVVAVVAAGDAPTRT